MKERKYYVDFLKELRQIQVWLSHSVLIATTSTRFTRVKKLNLVACRVNLLRCLRTERLLNSSERLAHFLSRLTEELSLCQLPLLRSQFLVVLKCLSITDIHILKRLQPSQLSLQKLLLPPRASTRRRHNMYVMRLDNTLLAQGILRVRLNGQQIA